MTSRYGAEYRSAPDEPLLVKPKLVLKTLRSIRGNECRCLSHVTDRGGKRSNSFAASARASTSVHSEAPLKTMSSRGMPSKEKVCRGQSGMSMARNSVNNILLIDGDLRLPRFMTPVPQYPRIIRYLEGTAG